MYKIPPAVNGEGSFWKLDKLDLDMRIWICMDGMEAGVVQGDFCGFYKYNDIE